MMYIAVCAGQFVLINHVPISGREQIPRRGKLSWKYFYNRGFFLIEVLSQLAVN